MTRLLRGIVGAVVGGTAGALLFTFRLAIFVPCQPSLPPTVAALAVVFGLLAAFSGARTILGVVTVLATSGVLVGYTPLVKWAVAGWERADRLGIAPVDAIVVLSGGLNPDSSLSPAAEARIVEGLRLWREQRAPDLVTTQERLVVGGRTITTDVAQARLVQQAGSASAWRVIPDVHSTTQEASRTAAVLLPLHSRQIIVVTSRLHARRACYDFERAGFAVQCVAAPHADAAYLDASRVEARFLSLRDLAAELLRFLRDALAR